MSRPRASILYSAAILSSAHTLNRRWRTSRSRARSSRMHHASYPVLVHRPAVLDWASRPLAELAAFRRARAKQFALATPPFTLQTPLRGDAPGSGPGQALALLLAFGSAQPGHRSFTDEVTRHARRTRSSSGGFAGLIAKLPWNAGFGLWRRLPTCNSQYCFGICARDRQQSSSSTARLFAALLPTLQGANRYANECCKLGLRQASFLSRLNDRRGNNMNLTGLHFAH